MALAMGMQMATARIGTALALGVSLPFARYFSTVSAPILLCLVLLCIGLIVFIVYTFMDKKLDESQAAHHLANNTVAEEDSFSMKDILFIIKNKAINFSRTPVSTGDPAICGAVMGTGAFFGSRI